MEERKSEAFGCTLLVDKPLEWTSFDVVNKLRYAARNITGRKKIKVGHAGTLDPLATGLMIICVGKHTKRIEAFTGLDKTYTGTFVLGATTPSYDRETPIDQVYDLPANNPELLLETARQFLGSTMQLPPAFSAKKVDGQKAYIEARKGKTIDLKPAAISIESFEIDAGNFPEMAFTLKCSKGTYVRSLVHDYARKLNSGAYLTSLKRTRIGSYSIEDAHSVEGAINAIKEAFIQVEQ